MWSRTQVEFMRSRFQDWTYVHNKLLVRWNILLDQLLILFCTVIEKDCSSFHERRSRRAERAEWGSHGTTFACTDRPLNASRLLIAQRQPKPGFYQFSNKFEFAFNGNCSGPAQARISSIFNLNLTRIKRKFAMASPSQNLINFQLELNWNLKGI